MRKWALLTLTSFVCHLNKWIIKWIFNLLVNAMFTAHTAGNAAFNEQRCFFSPSRLWSFTRFLGREDVQDYGG